MKPGLNLRSGATIADNTGNELDKSKITVMHLFMVL